MKSPVASQFTRLDAAALIGDVCAVARRLLGVRLVRVQGQCVRSGIIVETEAYHQSDPASHSHRGPTPRNRVMFDRPGLAYVYYIYGKNYCMNVVCEPAGIGAAVLIRALEPELGRDAMARSRGRSDALTSGPGRLCQALEIDRQHDGTDLLAASDLFLARGVSFPDAAVVRTPRIGISQATDLNWRFAVADNPHVSRTVRTPALRRRL